MLGYQRIRGNPFARRGLVAGRHVGLLLCCAAAGLLLTSALGLQGAHHEQWFAYVTVGLLAVGLYSATCRIDLAQAKADLPLIARIITVGVVVKAALIGGSLALLFGDVRLTILGVVMAQIDPVSTAALESSERLSPRMRTLVRACSSGDDPVTVLLMWAVVQGIHLQYDDVAQSLLDYVDVLGRNVVLAGLVVGVAWWTRRMRRFAPLPPLAAGATLAVSTGSMLTMALTGLFLRWESVDRWIDRITRAIFVLATMALGVVLAADLGGPEQWLMGVVLGLLTFGAHAVVALTPLIGRSLAWTDRMYFALAQQNGLTATMLAIAVPASVYPHAGPVIGSAIVTVTIVHTVANAVWDINRKRATAHS